MITLSNGARIPRAIVGHYMSHLIDQFFKILPLKEDGEPSLEEYMRSLQVEITGFFRLIDELQSDTAYLTLLSILQYLSEHNCDTTTVKREVFKAISICEKLKERYGSQHRAEVAEFEAQ